MFALSQNPVETTKLKPSFISRVLTPFVFGFVAVCAYLSSEVTNYLLMQNPIIPTEVFTNSIFYFSVIAYIMALLREKIQEKIMDVLSPVCRKIISKLSYWFYLLIGWYIFLILRATVLNQFTELATLLDLSIIYSLYALLISLIVFSFAVFIPTSKYLASKQRTTEERKLIANSVTFLTPLLGFPWAFTAFSIWARIEIPQELSWIIYVIIFLVYIALFFGFVDFSYYSGALDKKSMDLEHLDKKQNEILIEIQKIGNNKNQDLLKKLVLESEISRIDREKQAIESRSLHPYKLIIPAVSLTVTIFVALLIELLKDNLPQLISG